MQQSPTLLALLYLCPVAMAQAQPTLRHVQGQHSLCLEAGRTGQRYDLTLGWRYHLTPCWQVGLAGGSGLGNGPDAVRVFFAQGVLARTLWQNYRQLLLGALAGPFVLFKKWNQQTTWRPKTGLWVGLELTVFLFGPLALCCRAGPSYLFRQGALDYFTCLGVRWSP